MDPVRNPYVPGAGASPPELAGREDLFTQAGIVLQRALGGKSARGFIATGLRGVGKTVVLARVEQLAQSAGYLTCFVEAQEEKPLGATLAPYLRRMMLELDRLGAVTEQVKRGLRVLKSFAAGLRIHSDFGFSIALDVEPERGTADTGDLAMDLPDMISALGHAAQSRHTGVALFIDEIQNLPEADLAALIMAMHRVMREGLPVVLMGAGLPHLVSMIGRAKSYAERLFEFPVLGPLAPAECEDALRTPAERAGVDFTPEAVAEVVRITRGYPYFLQEWAYHAWNVAHGDRILAGDIQVATEVSLTSLDGGFFRMRYARLTPREREYCQAMAELGAGSHRSAEVAGRMGVRTQVVAPVRATLVRKGMIYSPRRGETAFTVPLFENYLHRIRTMGADLADTDD
ncbi:AAA family ATPase [Acetobacter sp. LMG 1627]|uniref:AAA family ATPase n=2 Tax=Acetobacter conturbans TaxID=1737472 RepID=A0ABX0JWA3_9PROT|nr:AAA family ATPase [Acetobacter conturbans]